MGYTMKRIKKLIIANLVVILLAIIIFTASMYFGGPVLEQGSRDILVLAGEQDEQQEDQSIWHIWSTWKTVL